MAETRKPEAVAVEVNLEVVDPQALVEFLEATDRPMNYPRPSVDGMTVDDVLQAVVRLLAGNPTSVRAVGLRPNGYAAHTSYEADQLRQCEERLRLGRRLLNAAGTINQCSIDDRLPRTADWCVLATAVADAQASGLFDSPDDLVVEGL